MTSVLNNFKTLLLLCRSQQERDKLLRDFIVLHHPDRHQATSSQKHLLISLATDLYHKAPPVFGAGRPYKKSNKNSFMNSPSIAFFCRCEAYLHYNRALLYRYDSAKRQHELITAKDRCRIFFGLYDNSPYISEVIALNRQIEELAYQGQVAL